MLAPSAAVKAIFLEVVAVDDPVARAALLSERCGEDVELLARVNALLVANDRALANAGTASFGAVDGGPIPAAEFPKAENAVEAEPTADLPGGNEHVGAVLGGKYKLMEEIGEGGMGSVFMAQQVEPVKRSVAVKVIKAGMDSKAVLARFEAERQALAMMDHPNIAKVLDAGTTNSGRPYFVMELVKGMPITEFCDVRKLTPRQRLELFVPVCNAIQHAHQKGVIHRDIKPNNVLVALYDDRAVPKVIDFGVAKATGQSLTDMTLMTGFGAVVGTPEYMSPEQASLNNLDIDTRSDVYSLGVLLYELLTGSTPVDRKSLGKAAVLEVLRIVREVEAPKPSQKLSTSDALPTISANRGTEPAKLSNLMKGELDWVLLKALEKDRARRYDTANGLARDIQRYLADEVVEARMPTSGYRLRKFARQHKGPLFAGGVVLLALLVGFAGTLFGLVRADQRQREAEQAREREAEQRAAAEAAIEETLRTLDAMVSGATPESLGTQAAISPEQKKFLAEVLPLYQKFAGRRAGDRATRARIAQTARRVGDIEFRLGRHEESAAAYRQARDRFEALTVDFPDELKYREQIASCESWLGVQLGYLGKSAEATEQHRKGLAIWDKLAADFPDKLDYRVQSASGHHTLGAKVSRQNYAAAEREFRLALGVWDKLTAEFPDNPTYRLSLGLSHLSLGTLAMRQNRSEAVEEYRTALAIREKLVADFPAVPLYRHELAFGHGDLGNSLVRAKKWAEAEEHLRTARTMCEKLITDFPAEPKHRDMLATTHRYLGLLYFDWMKWAEAEGQFRKSLLVRQKLVADAPTVPAYRGEMAEVRNALAGLLLEKLGRGKEAEEERRKELTIREQLVADFPAETKFRAGLGVAYFNFGVLMLKVGKGVDSLPWYQKAIDTLRSIHEKDPQDEPARIGLRGSHANRALVIMELGRFAEAVADWDRAIPLSLKEEQPRFRAFRATALQNCGREAEAVAEVAELRKLSGWNAGQLYDFACAYSVASAKIADKKAEYADAAMELLTKAVKAGWKDSAHIKRDADMDPLRDRDDFRKLLATLEKDFPLPPPREKK